MSARQLEIAANSPASALAAQAGGADRVELCENLGEGGCTPSYGSIAVARERLRIGLHVLVRPRAGDFVYDDGEREVMLRDIEACVRLGCDGVVVGALDPDGQVDLPLCRALVDAAGPLQMTFHRAFDVARDRERALHDVIALGCARVLTSGGAADAAAGVDAIAACVRAAGPRLRVMAGAGITPANVAAIAARTGVGDLHASARELVPAAGRGALPGLAADRWETSVALVRALRQALGG